MRLSIGNEKYRLAQIMKLVPYHRTYKLNGTTVKKAALLKYGKSERTFRFDVISNSPCTEGQCEPMKAGIFDEKTDQGPLIEKKRE